MKKATISRMWDFGYMRKSSCSEKRKLMDFLFVAILSSGLPVSITQPLRAVNSTGFVQYSLYLYLRAIFCEYSTETLLQSQRFPTTFFYRVWEYTKFYSVEVSTRALELNINDMRGRGLSTEAIQVCHDATPELLAIFQERLMSLWEKYIPDLSLMKLGDALFLGDERAIESRLSQVCLKKKAEVSEEAFILALGMTALTLGYYTYFQDACKALLEYTEKHKRSPDKKYLAFFSSFLVRFVFAHDHKTIWSVKSKVQDKSGKLQILEECASTFLILVASMIVEMGDNLDALELVNIIRHAAEQIAVEQQAKGVEVTHTARYRSFVSVKLPARVDTVIHPEHNTDM